MIRTCALCAVAIILAGAAPPQAGVREGSVETQYVSCQTYNKMGFADGALRRTCNDGFRVASASHCQTRCSQCSTCRAWVTDAPAGGGEGTCWMTSGEANFEAHVRQTAGLPCKVEECITYSAVRLDVEIFNSTCNDGITVNSDSECSNLCAGCSTCNAWVTDSPTALGMITCWMHSGGVRFEEDAHRNAGLPCKPSWSSLQRVGFCPAVRKEGHRHGLRLFGLYDKARNASRWANSESHVQASSSPSAPASSAARARASAIGRRIAVAFILGCNERMRKEVVLTQVELIQNLRHSIRAKSRYAAWLAFIVVSASDLPAYVHESLMASGFDVRLFPHVSEGLTAQDQHMFKEFDSFWRASLYPTGWYYGWLKYRLSDLTPYEWILYFDNDMLAVGSLDPLLAAPLTQWPHEADFAICTTVGKTHEFNTGLMLVRTGSGMMKEHVSRQLLRWREYVSSLYSVHEQTVTNLVLSEAEDLGEAVFRNGVLQHCSAPARDASGSRLRFCRLPLQFNARLPTVWLGDQMARTWEPGVRFDLSAQTVPQAPIVVFHFTGPSQKGRPWEKFIDECAPLEKQWWYSHMEMCMIAKREGEPPCAIQCS